jgi:hypothetical protein
LSGDQFRAGRIGDGVASGAGRRGLLNRCVVDDDSRAGGALRHVATSLHDRRLALHDRRLALHDGRLVLHDRHLALHDRVARDHGGRRRQPRYDVVRRLDAQGLRAFRWRTSRTLDRAGGEGDRPPPRVGSHRVHEAFHRTPGRICDHVVRQRLQEGWVASRRERVLEPGWVKHADGIIEGALHGREVTPSAHNLGRRVDSA